MTDREDEAAPPPLAWLKQMSARLPGGQLANAGLAAVERAVTQIEPVARLGMSELEQRVPVLRWAKVQREQIERQALRRLRQRMEHAAALDPDPPPSTTLANPPPGSVADAGEDSSAQLLGRLLETGLRQTAAESLEATLRRAVRELVPDEAKLLTAMVGDTGQAMVHVNIGRQRVLSYVTSAARAANVKSKDLAPAYVRHLIELGLVEVGPEDVSIPMEYELLEGEATVREVLEGTHGPRLLGRARIERGTIRLTPLGEALWASYSGNAQPDARPRSTAEELP